MKQLHGIARDRKLAKEKKDNERAVNIARKREALATMQESHKVVKELSDLDYLSEYTNCIASVTCSITRTVLVASLHLCPCILLIAFTVKVISWFYNLF